MRVLGCEYEDVNGYPFVKHLGSLAAFHHTALSEPVIQRYLRLPKRYGSHR
jgi:hypothetical protein